MAMDQISVTLLGTAIIVALGVLFSVRIPGHVNNDSWVM